MQIRDAYRYDARAAACEMIESGFTVVDDIGEGLWELCRDEMMDELDFAAEVLDLAVDRLGTGWGPVFVFRDRRLVTLRAVKEFVFWHRPRPDASK